MKKLKKVCPSQFQETLEDFVAFLQAKELRKSTIFGQSNIITSTLLKLDSYGIMQLGQITPSLIYRLYEDTSDKQNFVYPMRSFLRFLYNRGVLPQDYSHIVPARKKRYPTPSVYSDWEIENFLATFDLSSPVDIRDYAISMLALRLGMRTSDIVALKLDNLDFNKMKISFTQIKTEVPQCLELVPEVRNALQDYIVKIRPNTVIQNVFLTLTNSPSPISAQTVYYRIQKHLLVSGINIGNRKCGAHALRMTLASELIAEKVPYDVVRKILGHEDAKTAKHYIQFDIEALRCCAIPVPPLSGRLYQYFAGKEELPL